METNSKIKKIVVFSHDAGGAQVLSSYLYLKGMKKIYGICIGPSKKIFLEKKIRVINLSFKKLLEIGDKFFTTTSWKSDIEKKAIKNLKKKNKKVITFIDHWANFDKRFDKKFIPNEIWSFDKTSKKICEEKFKKTKIFLKRNYFHIYAKKKIRSFKKLRSDKNKFLYLTEPLTQLYLKLYKKKISSPEIINLNYFLNKIKSKNIKVTIRVHPNDRIKKYLYVKKKFKDLNITFDSSTSIYKQLATHKNIVSFQSSIMLLAKINNNRVICSSNKKSFKIHYLKKKQNYLTNIPVL